MHWHFSACGLRTTFIDAGFSSFFTQIGNQAVCQGSHMESRGFKQKRHQSVTKLRTPRDIHTKHNQMSAFSNLLILDGLLASLPK